MTSIETGATTLAALLAASALVWLVSVKLRNASIVDICWGPGFALSAWLSGALFNSLDSRMLLVAILVTVWAARLAAHIFLRNSGYGEDPRYVSIRQRVGKSFWWSSLFIVFWLQAVLVWIISMPLFVVARNPGPPLLTITDVLGVAIFLCGLAFESIGDEQLRRFKANPANKGRVLNAGLWRYTRHPNYFGDALLWWGLYVIATTAPYGVWTIFSPALMTFLLVRVSGVALLERGLKKSKPEYADYIARTSAFLPMPPRAI